MELLKEKKNRIFKNIMSQDDIEFYKTTERQK